MKKTEKHNTTDKLRENIQYVKRIKVEDRTEEEELFIKTKRTHKFKEKYLSFFQGEYMEQRLQFRDLKEVFGQKTELLFFLMNNMGTDNTVHLKQSTIAKDLNINKGNLSRYLKEFRAIGLIKDNEGHIAFNDKFIYKGQVKKYNSCHIDN